MTKCLGFSAAAMILLLSMPIMAFAEVTEFGGFNDKFKGAGDKIPPACSIDVPRAATQPFTIFWGCSDDNALTPEIRTELWMIRKDSQATEKVAEFLGFPANRRIDEQLLRVTNFTDGLPVSFRLVAIDRAGISAISPTFTVRAQDNSVQTCTMQISTEETASSGDTVGTPAQFVVVTDTPAQTTEQTTTSIVVSSGNRVQADPCEVESVCADSSRLTMSAKVSLSTDGSTASGTVTVVPGSVVVDTTGSYSVQDSQLQSLDLSGTTTIGGANATVTFSCKN